MCLGLTQGLGCIMISLWWNNILKDLAFHLIINLYLYLSSNPLKVTTSFDNNVFILLQKVQKRTRFITCSLLKYV